MYTCVPTDMAEKINAGEVPSSGPHITSLHPCNNPSMYAPTNRKQRDYKRKMRMRDYRLPNPDGLKGLRITDEVSMYIYIYMYECIYLRDMFN